MPSEKMYSFSRRRFLARGVAAAGAAARVAVLPAGARTGPRPQPRSDERRLPGTFRNACPRNCYDTCSIKTYVQDGVVKFIEGASGVHVHGRRPVREGVQPTPGGPTARTGSSTPWSRTDAALASGGACPGTRPWTSIAKKMLQLKEEDGSLLGLGMTKYSGNFGITNYGVEGMMSSLRLHHPVRRHPVLAGRHRRPELRHGQHVVQRPRGHGQGQATSSSGARTRPGVRSIP